MLIIGRQKVGQEEINLGKNDGDKTLKSLSMICRRLQLEKEEEWQNMENVETTGLATVRTAVHGTAKSRVTTNETFKIK